VPEVIFRSLPCKELLLTATHEEDRAMRRGNVILAVKAACFFSLLYSAHGDWDDDLRLAVTFHKQYNHPRARELIEELAKDIEIRKEVTTWLVNLPNMPWFWRGSK
jgi:hypothetical protein